MPVVYLASSLALAALELLVHIDYERALQHHVAIPVDFDESLLFRLDTAGLQDGWQAADMLDLTQKVGDAWVAGGASALLEVPSRVVPAEHNYLLNPQHSDATQVIQGDPRPFRFDPRLLKR